MKHVVKCPICGTVAQDFDPDDATQTCTDCDCEWVACPSCHSCVAYWSPSGCGDGGDVGPCEHVVYWDNSGDPHWENEQLRKEFRSHLAKMGLTEEESGYQEINDFMSERGLSIGIIQDSGSHGSQYAAFYFAKAERSSTANQ